MEYVKVNPGFVCEVGDIFEYPKTGEYEKLRGERIMVLEMGKGCNPYHTYIRVLSFRPIAGNDGFHFSCDDLYMDKVLEHWRFVGHMDISSFLGDEESTEPDYAMFFTAATLAQAADLRNENEKLKTENKRLLDALSESESKAHSRLDRITFLLHKVDELEDEVENVKDKLTADNARYLQSMTCAEKQLTEAAKRIHGAMEHLNATLCGN